MTLTFARIDHIIGMKSKNRLKEYPDPGSEAIQRLMGGWRQQRLPTKAM